jgi:uncharacterized membrane protein YraQ (UPF0718 family)
MLAVPAATLAGAPLYANVAAGIALFVPSLIPLKRVMTLRLLAVFTATVTLGIMLIGSLLDAIHSRSP